MRFTILVLALMTVVGCGRAQPGWGVRTITGNRSLAGVEPVLGIDEYSANFGTYGNVPAVCIWIDSARHSSSASRDKKLQAVIYTGSGGAGDNAVDYRCETQDGKTGLVTIGGQKFRLEEGALFLVQTCGQSLEVKQLKRDLNSLEMSNAGMLAFAENDVELREFFGAAESSPESLEPAAD